MGNRRSWGNAHSPYWSLHVEAWRRSGLSRAEYCAAGREAVRAQRRFLDFGPVLHNRVAMGYVLGYGAHCFELYCIRTWIVTFWTFVAAQHSEPTLLGPVAVSVVFSLLAMPASILGNEAALHFGRYRALVVLMTASAAVALAIGVSVASSPLLVLALLLIYALTVPADSGALTSGMAMSASASHKGTTWLCTRRLAIVS